MHACLSACWSAQLVYRSGVHNNICSFHGTTFQLLLHGTMPFTLGIAIHGCQARCIKHGPVRNAQDSYFGKTRLVPHTFGSACAVKHLHCCCQYIYFCLQERLRTLRASLGSIKTPLAEEGAAPHQRLAAPTPPHPKGTRQRTPPKMRTGQHPTDASLHSSALIMVPHSRKSTADPPRAAANSPGADGRESAARVGDSCAAGRLLECQAVQGLCQLLEHHLAVLEQSQQPLSNLLQPEALPDGTDIRSDIDYTSQSGVVSQSLWAYPIT